MPPCRCSVLYHGKNDRQCPVAWSMPVKRRGKPGWYFKVLNCASENGLSSETCGRLNDRVTPRSASSCAVHLLVIGRTAIGMQGQDLRLDTLLGARLFDQSAGQRRVLPVGHHPAHRVAAEDVEQDVEVVVGPLLRPQQFRYVPAPHLVRRGGHEFGLAVLRMLKLIAALANRSALGQDPVHRALGAESTSSRRASVANTSAGDRSTKRSELSTSTTRSRSALLKARAGVGRGCWCPGVGLLRR